MAGEKAELSSLKTSNEFQYQGQGHFGQMGFLGSSISNSFAMTNYAIDKTIKVKVISSSRSF